MLVSGSPAEEHFVWSAGQSPGLSALWFRVVMLKT